MPSKNNNKNMPKDGWVEELREAEAQAEAEISTSAETHLRVARAAGKLRLWEKCQAAAETGVSIGPESPLRAQLIECQKQAVGELFIKERFINSPPPRHYEVIRKRIIREAQDVNTTHSSNPTFSNLNVLQSAVLLGDVRILEDVVSLGAAIDYPVLAEGWYEPHQGDETAPQGTTALAMCCATLVLYGNLDSSEVLPVETKRIIDGNLECAILLVQLGADCQKKLNFPDNTRRRPQTSPSMRVEDMKVETVFRQLGLYGKTAQELAQISKYEDLIKVIAKFENKEKKIASAICRCGSRLPWRQCHAGKRIGESPIFMEVKGKIVWRFSPLAPCFCDRQPVKIHFKCCWSETSSPHYQDDDTACLNGTMVPSLEKKRKLANLESDMPE
jgi:hypothetical protein